MRLFTPFIVQNFKKIFKNRSKVLRIQHFRSHNNPQQDLNPHIHPQQDLFWKNH